MSEQGAPPDPNARRALVLFVSAIVFVDTIFYTAIEPLLPHYAHALQLGKSGSGILVAAYAVGTLVGSIPGGLVASHFGVRVAVVTGLTLMSAATLVFGFAHSIVLLDIARFVQGVGGAFTWAGGLAWLASGTPKERRAAALGVAFSAAIVGSLFGPVVGAVASRVGTGPTFAGATAAAAVLIVSSLFVPVPVGAESQSLHSAVSALRDSRLLAGLWLTVLVGLAFGVIDVLVPLRLSHLGAGPIVIAAAFIGASIVDAVLVPLVGRVADRRGRLLPVRVSTSFAILVCLLLPSVASAAALVAVVIVGDSAFGTLFVPASALVSDGAEGRNLHQGLAFGMSNLAWAGGQAVAAIGAGAIAQATSDSVPYAIVAATFGLTLVLITVRRTKDPGELSPRRVETSSSQ
jgi:MFS family permease